MSSIFSDIEVSNMSLLTYGAIGITSIVLAVVTIFDKEGGPEIASVAEPEVSPDETSVAGLFSNNEKPEEGEASSLLPEVFSNTDVQEDGSEGSQGSQGFQEPQQTEQDISEEENITPDTEEPEVQQPEEEKRDTLLGGKKRKPNTKKNVKSRGKKQRKTRSK
jgi:hypothetical protein